MEGLMCVACFGAGVLAGWLWASRRRGPPPPGSGLREAYTRRSAPGGRARAALGPGGEADEGPAYRPLSHELRIPLMPVLASAGLLERRSPAFRRRRAPTSR